MGTVKKYLCLKYIYIYERRKIYKMKMKKNARHATRRFKKSTNLFSAGSTPRTFYI